MIKPNTITSLNPYGQHAWHVVAYHYERAQESRRKPRPKSTCLEVRQADHCSHITLYLCQLIDIALLYRDYEAAGCFVDMLVEYRDRSMGVRHE